MTNSWSARYQDLTGKTIVLAAQTNAAVTVARAVCTNQPSLAAVAPSKAVIDEILAIAEAAGVPAIGVTGDPSEPSTWERVAPHAEQRLGPIDIVVSIATAQARSVVAAALLPDMVARGRGVLIEVDQQVPAREVGSGVRHRAINGGPSPDPADLAAIVLMCASDTLTAPSIVVDIR